MLNVHFGAKFVWKWARQGPWGTVDLDERRSLLQRDPITTGQRPTLPTPQFRAIRRRLGQVRNYALTRLALWLSKRGSRRRAWGWGMTQVLLSANHLGLISLDGIVVPPRPFRAWKVECRR
ncbi:MAG: hypothetical protein WBV74_08055 [Pseudonocardiaceae bacterium]